MRTGPGSGASLSVRRNVTPSGCRAGTAWLLIITSCLTMLSSSCCWKNHGFDSPTSTPMVSSSLLFAHRHCIIEAPRKRAATPPPSPSLRRGNAPILQFPKVCIHVQIPKAQCRVRIQGLLGLACLFSQCRALCTFGACTCWFSQ